MSKNLSGGVRRWAALLTSAALLAQLISFAPPAIAAAPAPREITELRSARGRIFDNGDGTYKYEAFSEAIHYQDTPGGGWKSIDSTLVRETNPSRKGWRNKANAFTVSLPEAVGAEWVSIESTAGVVKYRPSTAAMPLRGGTSSGATGTVDPLKPKEAEYKGAFGQGVDLEYVSTADGLKETIVLDRYREENVFTFDLTTGDLDPRMTEGGGIGLYSAESTAPVYLITPPFMEDSLQNEGAVPAHSTDVSYVLVPNGSEWRVSVVADKEWLQSEARVWPVRIDPCIIYQPYGTFENNGYTATMDSFVTNAYPNSNYGSSSELKVAYYPGAGVNYSYVMPDVSTLMDFRQHAEIQIINADLNMYCTWRYDHGTGAVVYAPIVGGWGEYSLTWNNRPSYDANMVSQAVVTEGQRTRFPVTSAVQQWLNGGWACGWVFWAPENTTAHWTKFASREAGGPVFECAFTTRPKVQAEVLNPETSIAGAPTARWSYSDIRYQDSSGVWHDFMKPLKRTEIQVKRLGEADATAVTKTVTGPMTVPVEPSQAEVPAPQEWEDGRYLTRLRVITDVTGAGVESVSNWSAWMPFEHRALDHGSDGLGVEPYRAQDSAGGATVDLATGRLLLSRTDFAAPGLGGALGAAFTYDSTRTADGGAGAGWQLSMPSLGFDDERAPNTSFEQWTDPYHPIGWYSTDPSSQPGWSGLARTGVHSLGLWRAPSFGGAQMVADSPVDVTPGQQLDAAGWVRAAGLTSGTGGGALLRIHYYDENDTWLSCTSSQLYAEYQSPVWRRIAVRGVVPAGAYRARLSFDMVNSHGQVCLDDVTFRDGTMGLTDADGTSRTLKALAGGAYQRDPLSGGLALKRTNVAAGIKPVTQTGAVCAGASTDGDYAITGGTGYDAVTWNAGAAWLKYDLPEARVLSEARLYLWDGDLRSYTYALEYSENGSIFYPVTYTDGTPADTVGRSWMTHRFTPVKAKSFRIVALGNTVNEGFHVAELELPVTTLSESPVAFDDSDRITGIADTSGNLIKYTYDAQGRLASSADSQGRHADLNWSGGELASLDWTGVGSASATPPETGVVSYVTEGDNVLVKRKADDGAYVTMATYAYTGGHITGLTDADGVATTIGYDTAGRVGAITAADGSHVTYDYAVPNQVTITAEGGTKSIARRVEFDPALGYQVTKTVVDPGPTEITATYTYDAYGHVATVTDPFGRVDTYTCDAHGNVTATTVNSTSTDDNLKLTSSATYTNDRVSSTTDAKGNVSRQLYDAKWRPISSTAAIGNSPSGAETTVEETYNEYGNRTQGDVPGSTAANLIENGTFENTAGPSGNGWALAGLTWQVVPSDVTAETRPVFGAKCLKASGASQTATSDQIAVEPNETYQLSVWAHGAGVLKLREYNASGGDLGTKTLATIADRQVVGFMRVSTTYVPPSGVATIAIVLSSGDDAAASFDNVRFEKANAVGPDNLIDNDSVERIVGSSPKGWTGVGGAPTVVDAPINGTERSLHLGATTTANGPSWESAPIAVTAGDEFTFGASVATQNVVLTSDGFAGVEVTFFNDAACTWTAGVAGKVWITGDTSLKGTTPWTRYAHTVTVPAGAMGMRVRPILWHATGDFYADHFTMEPVAARELYAYDESHTYRTATTILSGAVVGAEYDSRGRGTAVTHADSSTATVTVETERDYDAFDRLTAAETAPDSALGITAAFTYTAAGRLETVTDPLDRTTTLAYLEGRLDTVTSPSGIKSSMTYDGLGRLASVTVPYRSNDETRTLMACAYDSLGRVSATTRYGEDGNVAATQTTAYDKTRVASVTWSGEATGTLAYAYDELSRVTNLAATGPAGASTIATTYDKASLPLTITLTALGVDPTAYENTFAKTGQWQTARMTDSSTWGFTVATDGMLRRVSAEPIGTAQPLASRMLDYDTALRQYRVRLATTGTFLAEEMLTYDGHGRVQTSSMRSLADPALDLVQSYGYDEAGRLTSWTAASNETTAGQVYASGVGASGLLEPDVTYGYDAAGNLKETAGPGGTTVLDYDDYENYLETATTGGLTTTYTHDDFGRRTHESSTETSSTYTWNSLGQLASVASEDTTATYEYGPSGMRERAVVESAEGTSTTTSAWVGSRLALERDSDGTTYRYLWGAGGIPLEIVVTTQGGASASYAYQCDRAGSVVALTDESGTVVASYSYDPWGDVLSTGGSDLALATRNPLRYRAYYFDTSTGHYYLPARYFDPATARFLSADPAPPSAGDPSSLNRYAYCVGDPVNASDPTGAVTDIEHDSWKHYYYDDPATAGNRPDALAATTKVRRPVSKARGEFNSQAPAGYATTTYDVVTVVGGDQVSVGPGSVAGTPPLWDSTPYGRLNLNFGMRQPDDLTWGLSAMGLLGDGIGLAGMVVSGALDIILAGVYYAPMWVEGQAPIGEVFWTGVGAFPYVSGIEFVVYCGGYDLIHWVE